MKFIHFFDKMLKEMGEKNQEWLLRDIQILGKIVKRERKRQGMTQGELANLVGLSRETVSKLENRNSDIKPSSLIEVMDFLRMDLVVRKRNE